MSIRATTKEMLLSRVCLIQDLKTRLSKGKATILRLEAIDKESIFEGVPEKAKLYVLCLNSLS